MINKNKIHKIIRTLLGLLSFTLILICAYMVILKLTGHSPTLAELISGFNTGLIIYILYQVTELTRFKGKTEEFMSVSKNTFRKIFSDMHSMEKRIEKRIDRLEHKVDKLENKIDLVLVKLGS